MMTHLPEVECAALQQAEPNCQQHEPEKHTVIEVELPTTAEQVTRLDVAALRCGAVRSIAPEIPVDLLQEGANMLELQMRQSRCLTPLSCSSKATQAILRQF